MPRLGNFDALYNKFINGSLSSGDNIVLMLIIMKNRPFLCSSSFELNYSPWKFTIIRISISFRSIDPPLSRERWRASLINVLYSRIAIVNNNIVNDASNVATLFESRDAARGEFIEIYGISENRFDLAIIIDPIISDRFLGFSRLRLRAVGIMQFSTTHDDAFPRLVLFARSEKLESSRSIFVARRRDGSLAGTDYVTARSLDVN